MVPITSVQADRHGNGIEHPDGYVNIKIKLIKERI